MNEEKRQREQILALNQVLAQQVIAKSRASQGKLSSREISELTTNTSPHSRTERVELQQDKILLDKWRETS